MRHYCPQKLFNQPLKKKSKIDLLLLKNFMITAIQRQFNTCYVKVSVINNLIKS